LELEEKLMGLDFLRNNGARRMREYDAQPLLLSDGVVQDDARDENVDIECEVPADAWKSRDVRAAPGIATWPYRPVRFVDGKDVGRTVAWLQSPAGHPVPVRLSEIGAVVMRLVDGKLRREFSLVERVISVMVDPFPWEEVESFAIALQERDFRLLACQAPEGGYSYDFERMRKTTQNRSNDEMIRLERQALASASDTPTVVDGRLEPRAGAFDAATAPVVGLIKTHSKNYLHPQGWRVFYDLRPGERTPAFRIASRNIDVVSWYLRLAGDRGELPNWGVVRLEMTEPFFKQCLAGDWSQLDRLSRLICEYRCRDQSYGRAAVSIAPIQQAEASLGAQFTQTDVLISQFYRMTSM
jgi:hypothetical protein